MHTLSPVILLALLGVPLAPSAAAQKGVDLAELTELAKQRAETLRPKLEARLQPHLDALSTRYDLAQVTVDETIQKVAKLGDSIVPLLLEKLEPRRESPKSRALAANCARVLERLSPASFVDELIAIARGENYTGVGHAIKLLGLTASERAGDALTRLLDNLDNAQSRIAVRALTQLEHKGAIVKIAKGLPYASSTDDSLACEYLKKIASPTVVPEVRRALKVVRRVPEIMRYLRLLAACAKHDAASAHQMLAFLDHEKIDSSYKAEIAALLRQVTPKGDKTTIDRLKKIIQKSHSPGTLELRAAVTLRALGDKVGPEVLKRTLHKLTVGSKTRKDYLHWLNLGEYYLEFGDFKRAVGAYKSAVDKASAPSVRSMLHIQIAKAQARRRPPRPRDVRNSLRDSGASYEKLMEAARRDRFLLAAMQNPVVKKFMDSFAK